MDRKAWLEERRKGLGGSDMADLFQIEPYGCQRRLWYDKRGQAPDYDRETTGAMERGVELEDIIAAKYSAETGKPVRKMSMRRSAEYDWALVNCDRMILNDVRGPGVLECKTANAFVYNKFLKEGLSQGYILQLQHALFVTGYSWGAFAILHPDSWRMSIFEVKAEPDINAAIKINGNAFWPLVENGPAPEKLEISDRRCQTCQFRMTCHAEEIAEMVMQSGQSQGDIERDDTIAPLLVEWRDAWAAADEATKAAEAVDEQVKGAMGERPAVDAGLGKVYFKSQDGRESFDKKGFIKAHPELSDEIKTKFTKKGLPFKTLKIYMRGE